MIIRETDGDGGEGSVPIRGIGTREATKGDVREGFGHAVGAPDGIGERFQFGSEVIVDGASTDDQMLNLLQSLTLLRDLKGVVDLHGNHSGEGEGSLVVEGDTLGTVPL
jgi:hypothetical protein